MKNLSSHTAEFESVQADNLSFTSVNNDNPAAINDVLAWNGSSWEVKAAADLGVGGGGGGSNPSSFETSIPQGVESYAIPYGPFSVVPKVASSLEINGDGEIIPYTMSGVSETGYHVVFSDETSTSNYSVHTVFGGESAAGGSSSAGYSEIAVTVSASKFYVDGSRVDNLHLQRGFTYRFDQSDSSNSGHPIKFSTTIDGNHPVGGAEYTTGVTSVGTPGSAGAYTEIILEQDTPGLYYYCENHSGMGGSALGEIVIKADGSVGIGTENPDQGKFMLYNDDAVAQVFGIGGTDVDYRNWAINAGGTTKGALHFQAGDSVGDSPIASSKTKVTFLANGNVGISTTNPGALLDINGPNAVGVFFNAMNEGAAGATFQRINANASPYNRYTFLNGNVGIGTTSPAFNLEIQGDEPIIMIKDSSSANLAYLGDGSGVGDHAQLALYNATDGTSTPTVLLNAGGSTYFNAGNVGIGTTSPSAKLDVNDFHLINGYTVQTTATGTTVQTSADMTSVLSGGDTVKIDGNVYTISSLTSTSLILSSPAVSSGSGLDIYVYGDSLTIKDGNVGIGTANPDKELHIHTIGGSTGDVELLLDTGAGSAVGKNSIINSYRSNANLILKTNNSPSMTINSDGNVGIGVTDAASRITTVSTIDSTFANVAPSVSDCVVSIVNEPTNEAENNHTSLQFNLNAGTHNNVASISLVSESATSRSGALAFCTDDGSTRDEVMRISSNSVGIGTTDPGLVKLHVVNSSAGNVATFSSTSSDLGGYIKVAGSRISGSSADVFLGNAETLVSGSSNTDGAIRTQGNMLFAISIDEKMRIDTNGNVGIGTTNPGALLDIKGANGLGVFFSAMNEGAAGATFQRINSNAHPYNRYTFLNGYVGINASTPSYDLHVNGSTYSSTGWTGSDDRLKHNEQAIVGAIETLSKITPKKYIKTTEMYEADHDFELDADGNPIDENGEPVEHTIEAGVIAQEVLGVPELAFMVAPEDVNEDGDVTGPHGLSYNSLFTYAIAAIQEQQQIIEELKTQNASLAAQNEDFESRISNLEK